MSPRAVVRDVAKRESIPAVEDRHAPDDCRNADELFLTSSVGELRPVETLDGGPVTRLLARRYDERVDRAC